MSRPSASLPRAITPPDSYSRSQRARVTAAAGAAEAQRCCRYPWAFLSEKSTTTRDFDYQRETRRPSNPAFLRLRAYASAIYINFHPRRRSAFSSHIENKINTETPPASSGALCLLIGIDPIFFDFVEQRALA